jgi:hypothetical protein
MIAGGIVKQIARQGQMSRTILNACPNFELARIPSHFAAAIEPIKSYTEYGYV